MTQLLKTWLSWSSGKDSAWALHQLKRDPNVELLGLFTTVNRSAERVAIHGVREALLQAQANSLGLPLVVIDLPFPCSNEDYQACMAHFHQQACDAGIQALAFGDLFLEDVRDYRLKTLEGTGLTPLFPLWGLDTAKLAQTMVQQGLKATIACVQSDKLEAQWLGRAFDQTLLDTLPEGIDPCGEFGEFHTFAWDGPDFSYPIAVTLGEQVQREGARFIDLLPAEE
ncbi:adenine nucleotide alpha hydrolase [Ferrimonas marina]|uniref:adenine nucleotide alpha hydrolase n=1 Tax=Ferrimonas marina TaxID=299255 RepID=UPI001F31FC6F|nr:adenine nucleotide alpha hydrolase [Ferrimonas marina]